MAIQKMAVAGANDAVEVARARLTDGQDAKARGRGVAISDHHIPLASVLRGLDATAVHSTTFTMEWPPTSGRLKEFPEIDRAAWFPLDVAAQKILSGQRPLIEELPKVVANVEGSL